MSRLLSSVLSAIGVKPKVKVKASPTPHASDGCCPRTSKPKVVNGRGRVLVEVDRRPLWQLRGWRVEGHSLIGAYRTPRGSFVGEIRLTDRNRPEYFILNPPAQLLRSSHGPCFRARGEGRYWIHFYQSSSEIDAGIVGVEKLIVAALQQAK